MRKIIFGIAILAAVAYVVDPGIFDKIRRRGEEFIKEHPGVVGRQVAKPKQAARARRVLAKLDGLYPSPMSAHAGVDGSIWITTKYGVHRFPEGKPADARTVIDPDRFRELFARKIRSFSVSHLVSDGTLWVGSWAGEVYRLQRGRKWEQILLKKRGPKLRITGILPDETGAFFAGEGLWRWSILTGMVEPIEKFKKKHVSSLARAKTGEPLAAAYRTLYRYRDKEWAPLWRGKKEDNRIVSLFVRKDGKLLIGTHNGYALVDTAGKTLERALERRKVTGFGVDASGGLWVATWENGLYVKIEGEWRRFGVPQGLAGDAISAFLIDPRDRVWIGINEKGTYTGKRKDLLKVVAAAAKS